jgi:hypothetical protein
MVLYRARIRNFKIDRQKGFNVEKVISLGYTVQVLCQVGIAYLRQALSLRLTYNFKDIRGIPYSLLVDTLPSEISFKTFLRTICVIIMVQGYIP